jgi:hypothetical protein
MASIKEQIIHELDNLSPEQQEQLLRLARRLRSDMLPPGASGSVLLDHMNDFEFAPDAVDEMMRIFEEGCKRMGTEA